LLFFTVIAGSLWGAFIGVDPLSAALASIALGGLGLSRHGPKALCRFAACVLLAATLHQFTERHVTPSPLGRAGVQGILVSLDCPPLRLRCRGYLKDVSVEGRSIDGFMSLSVYQDDVEGLKPGAVIRVPAWVSAHRRNRNPGLSHPWHPPSWRWRGVALDTPVVVGQDVQQRLWDDLRARLTFDDPDVTALYRALLLGDRAGLPRWMQQDFVDTGTAHILAISGLHLAILGWGFFRVLLMALLCLPRLGQTRRLSAVAAAGTTLFVWGYVILVARTPATYRAALVLTYLLGAQIFQRQPSPWRALLVAATLIIATNPVAVLTASFQLSFAAAAGIIASRRVLTSIATYCAEPGRFSMGWSPVVTRLGQLGWVTFIAFLVTTPLSMAYFGTFSPIGLLVNLIVVPLTTVFLVPVGFGWFLVAQVSSDVAQALAFIPEGLGDWLLTTTHQWADWVGSSQKAMWPHWLGLGVSVLVILCCVVHSWKGRTVMGTVAIFLVIMVTGGSTSGLRVSFLDVGHGDAILLQSDSGRTMLVDTGGSRRSQRATRYLADRVVIPALARLGVDHIDVLAISHAHADHVATAAHIARRIPVGRVWLPPCGHDVLYVRQLKNVIRVSGGQVRTVSRFDVLSWDRSVELRALWPRKDILDEDGWCETGLNNGSLVLEARFAGRTILLTGDLEKEGEDDLLNEGLLGHVHLLKVPHHGSRSSSTTRFLRTVRPDVAVVTGRMGFGHMPPHLSVLQRYRRQGVKTYLTGSEGALQVHIAPDGWMSMRRLR
jgi:competence protein ComEC